VISQHQVTHNDEFPENKQPSNNVHCPVRGLNDTFTYKLGFFSSSAAIFALYPSLLSPITQ